MKLIIFTYQGNFVSKLVHHEAGQQQSNIRIKYVEKGVSRSIVIEPDALRRGEYNRIAGNSAITILCYEQQCFSSRTISLSQNETYRIGRSKKNDIIFNTKHVSTSHAIVSYLKSGWQICDCESTNGTYVNGQTIHQQFLQDNDVVNIAGWEFVFKSGLISFTHIPEHPSFNTHVEFCASTKTVGYPAFSRAPRVKTIPIEDDYDFIPPGQKGNLAQASFGDQILSAAPAVAAGVLTGNPLALAMAVPNIVISGKNRKKQKKAFEEREKDRVAAYHRYMNELNAELWTKYNEQRKLFYGVNPAPNECLAIAEERKQRLWERSVFDEDYLSVRLGLGEIKSGLSIRVPKESLSPEQDELFKIPREFAEKYTYIQNAPITFNIKESITTGITGLRESVINCVNEVVMNIATHHPYDEVKIVCLYKQEEQSQWAWMRWLPHIWSDDKSVRYMASDKREAKELLREFDELLKTRQKELDEIEKYDKSTKMPFYVFIIADKSLVENHIIMRQLLSNNPYLGVISILAYSEISLLPNACQSIVECYGQQIELYNREDYSAKKTCAPDCVEPLMLERFSRALAPIRLKKLASESSMPSCVTFLQGYGVKRVEELNVLKRWQDSAPFDRIEAPIGIRHGGEAFLFDLHEREFGPHGLAAGTTGYGKSELLQTWLLSMALNYRPDELSYVLIDFKGEGLAGSLEKLPHVAGKISNIDISGITRNLTALEAELLRRQRVFSKTKIKDIYKYQKAFREGMVSEQMSHLVIVIDEFAQMKKDYPEYMNAFTSIARVGRSLGVHLILATQSPSGVVDQQILSNARFRMCLKTANVGESREMLGKSDAVNLTTKGRAIIQVGADEVYEQVQTFWSGAPYNPEGEFLKSSKKITLLGTRGQRIKPEVYDKTVIVKKEGEEEFNILVDYIAKEAQESGILSARKIWEEALPKVLNLEELIEGKKAFYGKGFSETNSGFAPIIGLVDAPQSQKQYPLEIDISKEGHTVFYGAPGTGKTTLLQTFILSSALMYTPSQINIYAMDFGNWGMKSLEGLPHVGGVANGNENEKIEKLVSMLDQELNFRKNAFSLEGVGSVEVYREVIGKDMPYIVLVIDNFNSVFASYPNLDDFFLKFVKEGSSLGLYLVATSGTINGMGFRISQYIKQSLALQMIDKADYISIVGRTEGLEPIKTPGRGLVKGTAPSEYQTAFAVKADSGGQKIKILKSLCSEMSEAWNGVVPAGIPVMPEIVMQTEMKVSKDQIEIGLDVNTVAPIKIAFKNTWHMLVTGLPKCGKSNMLLLLLNGLIEDPNAEIIVYEPKNKNFTHLEGRIRRFTDSENFDAFMESIVPELQERKRQHNSGKSDFETITIVIDDYEICFDKVADKTIARLEQIVKLAKGLGVYLYIAGKASSITTLKNQGDSLTILMVSGANTIALGGDLLKHPNYQCDLSASERTDLMANYEGYFFEDGSALKFKAALAGRKYS